MTRFIIPQIYQPGGGPLRWQDDQTNMLPFAVMAFLQYKKHIDLERLELVRTYLEYYINAPCWDANPHHDEESRKGLRYVREMIKNAKTFEEVDAFLHACLSLGIDPL